MGSGENSENEAAVPQESKAPTTPPKLLNAAQAAFEIGVTKADIARLREEGKLTGVRGTWGRWYYSVEALSAVITNTPPPEATPEPKPKTEGISLASIMNELGPLPQQEDNSNQDALNQAPLVRMANAILVQAIDSGASDIHIEPDSRNLRVRIRVDGLMREIMKIPNHIKGPLIQRYKVMADINVLERRMPQAGFIPLMHSGIEYDIRVSTFPSRYGEYVTMRVLTRGNFQRGFHKLGMPPEVHAGMEMCLQNYPSGLTLIVGPGGSGITTTAYAALHKLNSVERKILTLEALPEYNLPGLAQNWYGGPKRSSLAEMLRLLPLMDVDTLFLGDINTPDALASAVETAFFGKRVAATMAADDTAMALWRLSHSGMFTEKKQQQARTESLIGFYPAHQDKLGLPLRQTLRGILAQRLVRSICTNCKDPYVAAGPELVNHGFPLEYISGTATLFRGKGCDACRGTGYRGRIGIFEFMRMNDEIAALVALRAPLSDIKDAAKANGMKEMREDALAKILGGLTTPEEVIRVLGYPQKLSA